MPQQPLMNTGSLEVDPIGPRSVTFYFSQVNNGNHKMKIYYVPIAVTLRFY